MKDLQNYLQAGEEVKYAAQMHNFLFVQPAVLLLFGWLFYETRTNTTHYGGLLLLLWGAVSLIQRILMRFGSFYVVTDKRVILKTGVISRKIVEMQLSKCEGLRITQSVPGRIFGYGTITVTTGGVTSGYPFVTKPFVFKQEINTQIG